MYEFQYKPLLLLLFTGSRIVENIYDKQKYPEPEPFHSHVLLSKQLVEKIGPRDRCNRVVSFKELIQNKPESCREVRSCYLDMVNELQIDGEVPCIADAAIGSSSISIYLEALARYCPHLLSINDSERTAEGRRLYEVIINGSIRAREKKPELEIPTLVIDAGQDAGVDIVGFAMYIIEQLMACEDNKEFIEHADWVILPNTNPDGLEYSRFNKMHWKKNMNPASDNLTFGVDISRNFDFQWSGCEKIKSGFDVKYPGEEPASEKETKFIQGILTKYKSTAQLYLSLRRDGHGIHYPYAYSNIIPRDKEKYEKVASEVASKVNIRAGNIQRFANNSINEGNGEPICGHSVDYAHEMGIPIALEMRMFLGSISDILSQLAALPNAHFSSLKTGYYAGIRQLFDSIKQLKNTKTCKK